MGVRGWVLSNITRTCAHEQQRQLAVLQRAHSRLGDAVSTARGEFARDTLLDFVVGTDQWNAKERLQQAEWERLRVALLRRALDPAHQEHVRHQDGQEHHAHALM